MIVLADDDADPVEDRLCCVRDGLRLAVAIEPGQQEGAWTL
jgi:hypothetical protein